VSSDNRHDHTSDGKALRVGVVASELSDDELAAIAAGSNLGGLGR